MDALSIGFYDECVTVLEFNRHTCRKGISIGLSPGVNTVAVNVGVKLAAGIQYIKKRLRPANTPGERAG
jgi:hypothetical protein